MRYQLLDILMCPRCKSFPLKVKTFREYVRTHIFLKVKRCEIYCGLNDLHLRTSDSVHELNCEDCMARYIDMGIISCPNCGREYPIIEEIPRFLCDLREEKIKSVMVCKTAKQQTLLEERKDLSEEEKLMKIKNLTEEILQQSLGYGSSERQKRARLNDLHYRIFHADKKNYYIDTFRDLISKYPSKILDVGTGPGGLLLCLNREFYPIMSVGVDISLKEARIAKIREPTFLIVNCDATQLPFRSNCFDLVVSSSVLEHVKNWKKVIKELSRISDNCFIVFGPNKLFPYDFGHIGGAPFVTFLPASIGKHIAYIWHRLRGDKMTLFQIQKELKGMTYISPFEFEKTCRRNGFYTIELFCKLLVSSVAFHYCYFSQDTIPGKIIWFLKRHQKLTRLIGCILSRTRAQPILCYYLTKHARI